MTFNKATNKLNKISPILWVVLFVSVMIGFGKDNVSFISTGTLLPHSLYQAAYLGMIGAMWSSACIHLFEILNNSEKMPRIAKISTWGTLIGLLLLACRSTWLYMTPGIEANIAPATLAGAITIAVGTAGNSIGRMYDGRYYGKS